MIIKGSKSQVKGSVLVEFALLLPIFIALILGVFELGWALFAQNAMQDATRQGTRLAVTENTGTGDITALIKGMLNANNIQTGSILVDIVPAAVSLQPKGTPITITVSIPYSSISILPTTIFLGNTTLTAQVTMAKEY